jgi:hypothetical protein
MKPGLCRKFQLDPLGDHLNSCVTHSGAKKTHDWMVDQIDQHPVPLVLDLRITHDRFGSSSDPSLNGNLHCPNNIDRSLNESVTDKVRKYRADYNNNPPNTVSCMPDIASTSGRLHSEFVRLLFLQTHRETDRFVATSGVQLAQSDRRQFHFRRTVFTQMG